MKIQLDTITKTVKIVEEVNLGELLKTLQQLLPNGLWKEFKLEMNKNIEWRDPIIIRPYYPPCPPYYNPYPWIMCTTTTSQMDLVSGIYNIDAYSEVE